MAPCPDSESDSEAKPLQAPWVGNSAGKVISISSRSSEWAISWWTMPGGLVNAGAGLQQHLAHPLVPEAYPALEHIDELDVERMGVLVAAGMGAGHGLDHMGADPAAGRLGDAEVAVDEEVPQALSLELPVLGMGDRKGPGLGLDMLHPRLPRAAFAVRISLHRPGSAPQPSPLHGQRRSTVMGSPPSGRSVRRVFGFGQWPATGTKRSRRMSVAKITTASISAKDAPMQMRGPAPNGR